MSNKLRKKLQYWKDQVDYDYLRSKSVEECAKRIGSIIESKEFIHFLWQEFSYWRGNIYVSSPDGHFECLHRDINKKKVDFQIRVPWLCIHKDISGSLKPEVKNGYKRINFSEFPVIVSEDFRDENEQRLLDKTQKEVITSSTLLFEWLNKRKGNSEIALLEDLCIIVTEGEMIFFRIFTDPDYLNKITRRELVLLTAWIKDNTHNPDVKGLLVSGADKFLNQVKNRELKVTVEQHELAWATARMNPKREMTILRSRNIIFFPCGRFYTPDGLSEVFFLGSFYNTRKMLDNMLSIVGLFSDLAYKGISLYQQKLGEDKLIYDRHHEFGNTIERLQSQLDRKLEPNEKLEEIRKKVIILKECYKDWIDPKRMEPVESVDISQLLKEIEILSELTSYPKHFSHLNSKCYVKANRRLLHTSIFELIRNSIKYTDESLSGNSLVVSAQIEDNRVSITISDTAISLTENFFEESSNPIMKQNGTHKGLHTTKKYIEDLGGSLMFVAKQPRGSLFTIILPAG